MIWTCLLAPAGSIPYTREFLHQESHVNLNNKYTSASSHSLFMPFKVNPRNALRVLYSSLSLAFPTTRWCLVLRTAFYIHVVVAVYFMAHTVAVILRILWRRQRRPIWFKTFRKQWMISSPDDCILYAHKYDTHTHTHTIHNTYILISNHIWTITEWVRERKTTRTLRGHNLSLDLVDFEKSTVREQTSQAVGFISFVLFGFWPLFVNNADVFILKFKSYTTRLVGYKRLKCNWLAKNPHVFCCHVTLLANTFIWCILYT
jgi:hypothetical protein